MSPQHGVPSMIRTISQGLRLINHPTVTHGHMRACTHIHTFGIRAGSDEQQGYFSGALTPEPPTRSERMTCSWPQKTATPKAYHSELNAI